MATDDSKGQTTIEIPVEREGRGGRPRTRGLTRSTGPRTLSGKQKSRYNALKHGLFAVGVLADRESYSDYQVHVDAFVGSLRPVGRLEEILVEKLAMLFWRYRRLLGAEAAALTLAADEEERKVRRQMRDGSIGDQVGLVHKAVHGENPYATTTVLKRLEELRRRVRQRGLDYEQDQEVLIDLFGYRNTGDQIEPRLTQLVEKYQELAHGEQGTPSDSQGSAGEKASSPSGAKKELLVLIDHALQVFGADIVQEMFQQQKQEDLSARATLIPRDEIADKLQRYEASLERAIDRTLSQLERLQRLRTGLPVPPPLKVDVTRD